MCAAAFQAADWACRSLRHQALPNSGSSKGGALHCGHASCGAQAAAHAHSHAAAHAAPALPTCTGYAAASAKLQAGGMGRR